MTDLAPPRTPRHARRPHVVTHHRDLCVTVAQAYDVPAHVVCPYHHRRYLMPRWLALVLAAVVCVLIALVLAPYVPEPGGQLIAIVGWIGAVVCAILAVVALVRGGANL